MKTSELIRQLQEADPSGETECCVGNAAVHFVERLPAYYDGALQVHERDLSRPGYNICGAKRTNIGMKVKIHVLSIADMLLDNPDLPVTYEGVGPQMEDHYRKIDDAAREEVRAVDAEMAIQSKG